MSRPLAGRVAVVTGASRGIGHATALALARAGADVVATARTQAALRELEAEIVRAGAGAVCFPLDLQSVTGIEDLAKTVDRKYGRLDILIGNAGVPGQIAPITEIDLASWNEALAVNVTANLCLIRAFDPLLRRSEAGRVVMVSSGVAQSIIPPNWSTYTATKAALEMLARTYAAETKGTAIRVNVFTPGPVHTRLYETVMPGDDYSNMVLPDAPAEKLVELCSPLFQDTGKTYNFIQKRLLSFRPPA